MTCGAVRSPSRQCDRPYGEIPRLQLGHEHRENREWAESEGSATRRSDDAESDASRRAPPDSRDLRASEQSSHRLVHHPRQRCRSETVSIEELLSLLHPWHKIHRGAKMQTRCGWVTTD